MSVMSKQIRFEYVLITPERATEMLEKNIGNRTLSKGQCSKIVSDMENGRFVETHQAIAIGPDGAIKDGQHRLKSIVDSGKHAWLWVATYLTKEAADEASVVIDRGRKRDLGDSIELSQVVANCGKARIATANVIHDIEKGSSGNSLASDGELVRVALESIDRFDRIRSATQVTWNAPAMAAFVWALQFDDRVVTLAGRLAQAKELSDVTGSEIALRDLVKCCGNGGRSDRLAYAVKVMRGIRAWLEGERLVKFMAVDRVLLLKWFRNQPKRMYQNIPSTSLELVSAN